MKLVPLGDRVVLKQLVAEETTKSGIVLPGQAQEKPQQAEVIAVGPGGVVDGKEVKISLTDSDYSDILDTIQRFQSTCSELSNNKMTAKYNVYKVTDPITKLTYDDEFGYYVAPEDIEESIKQRVQNNNFDHIFIVMKLRR